MEPSTIISTIIITALLFLLLIAGIAFSFLKIVRQRTEKQIALKDAQLNYEREVRQIEDEVGEELRRQFAQELHDNIGHQVTCLRLAFENYKLDHPESVSPFSSVDQYLDEVSQEIRLLSRTFNQDYINGINLLEALKLECEKHKKRKIIETNLQTNGDNDLNISKDQQLILFRIFQEVSTNTIKHSRASRMEIKINRQPDFEMVIADNGIGFDFKATIDGSNASGLRNIIKRSEMAGLVCEVDTSKNNGCNYRFTLNNDEVLNDE